MLHATRKRYKILRNYEVVVKPYVNRGGSQVPIDWACAIP